MREQNEFDELSRRKLEEREFPFQEEHWLAVEKQLAERSSGRRYIGWWLLPILLIGIGGAVWFQQGSQTVIEEIAQTEESSTGGTTTHDDVQPSSPEPNGSNEPAIDQASIYNEEPDHDVLENEGPATAGTVAKATVAPRRSSQMEINDAPGNNLVDEQNDQQKEQEDFISTDQNDQSHINATPSERNDLNTTGSTEDVTIITPPIVGVNSDEQDPDEVTGELNIDSDKPEEQRPDDLEPAKQDAAITITDGPGLPDIDPLDKSLVDEKEVVVTDPNGSLRSDEDPIEEEANANIEIPDDDRPLDQIDSIGHGIEEPNEKSVAVYDPSGTPVGAEQAIAADTTMVKVNEEDTLITENEAPLDTSSTPNLPEPITPLVDPRSPFEIGIHAGTMFSNSIYGGTAMQDRNSSVDAQRTNGGGIELMRMGKNVGIGGGIHYYTYAERIRSEELSYDEVSQRNYYFLSPVDTTILFVTDTVVIDGVVQYLGESINTTVNVLDQGVETVTTNVRLREARDQVNRTSYLEIPLLLDLRLVQGRWDLGLRGGPALGILSYRRGSLPDNSDVGYLDLQDQQFRSLVLGYTARAYIRHRFSAGWSVGLEPMIRGHFMSGLEHDAITRRPYGMGGVISLNYRFK